MLNNLICVSLLLILAGFFARKKYAASLSVAIIYIYVAPLVELRGRSINQTYLLTFALVVLWFIYYLVHRSDLRQDFTRPVLQTYLICMAVLLLAYTVGFLLHGTASKGSFLVAMAGEVNVVLLTLALFLLLQRLSDKQVFCSAGLGFGVVLCINFFLVLWQKLDLVSAYRLMDAFYVPDNRFKPLFVVWQAGAFDRVMGTFFTPILLGTTFLLLAAILLTFFVRGFGGLTQRSSYLLLIPLVLLTTGGILAFSKMYMLGLPIIFLLSFIAIIYFYRDRGPLLKRLGIAFAAVALTYVIIYFLLPPSFENIRRYYYGYLLTPFGGLKSRYADLDEVAKAVVKSAESETDGGIAVDAFSYFLRHPVFGVGPLPVDGEFLGDSQLISTLHSGGVVGALAYLFFYVFIFIDALRRRSLAGVLLVSGLGMSCLASGALTVPETLFFIALLMRRWGVGLPAGKNSRKGLLKDPVKGS